jgi:hypothetical protein
MERETLYSKNVIEFTTVAHEYCVFMENIEKYSKADFIKVASCMLPLIYVKTAVVPEVEPALDGVLEEFVDEFSYEKVRSTIRKKITKHDDYLEVFKEDMRHSETPIIANISEDMADIYQSLKNFCETYRLGVDEAMNDALYAVIDDFKHYWGQRLCNAQRALHCALYSGEDLSDEKGVDEEEQSPWANMF